MATKAQQQCCLNMQAAVPESVLAALSQLQHLQELQQLPFPDQPFDSPPLTSAAQPSHSAAQPNGFAASAAADAHGAVPQKGRPHVMRATYSQQAPVHAEPAGDGELDEGKSCRLARCTGMADRGLRQWLASQPAAAACQHAALSQAAAACRHAALSQAEALLNQLKRTRV